jgi:hypothetical protein
MNKKIYTKKKRKKGDYFEKREIKSYIIVIKIVSLTNIINYHY